MPPTLNRCPWGQLLLDDGKPVGNLSAAPPWQCADRVGARCGLLGYGWTPCPAVPLRFASLPSGP